MLLSLHARLVLYLPSGVRHLWCVCVLKSSFLQMPVTRTTLAEALEAKYPSDSEARQKQKRDLLQFLADLPLTEEETPLLFRHAKDEDALKMLHEEYEDANKQSGRPILPCSWHSIVTQLNCLVKGLWKFFMLVCTKCIRRITDTG